MLSRNKKVKEEICKVLEQYKEGKVETYYKENANRQINSVQPHYHNSIPFNGGRRYRFKVCEENNWNKINISDELRERIIKQVKNILDENNIKYEDIRLDIYYPYMESRMQYASWIRCLDIYD